MSVLSFGVSNRPAVSIGTAKLKAAKDAGFVKDDVLCKSLTLNHKKIVKSKQRVMKTCEEKHFMEIKDEDIQFIMFVAEKTF